MALALANHELGNVTDVAACAAIARAAGAAVHSDAVQAAGKIPVDVGGSASTHWRSRRTRSTGPKGRARSSSGVGLPFEPVVRGGHQERELRAGTENVAGIVGFGVAARLARAALTADAERVAGLRDRLADRCSR